MLLNVSEKNDQIRSDLERGKKIVDKMLFREFFYKAAIHGAAFLLFILNIILIVVLISKDSSSGN